MLSRNIRRLGNKEKFSNVRLPLPSPLPTIICLQESKLDDKNYGSEKLGRRFTIWYCLDSRTSIKCAATSSMFPVNCASNPSPPQDLARPRFSVAPTCERLWVRTQKTWIWTWSSFTALTGWTRGQIVCFLKDSSEKLMKLFFTSTIWTRVHRSKAVDHILGIYEPTDSKLTLLLYQKDHTVRL